MKPLDSFTIRNDDPDSSLNRIKPKKRPDWLKVRLSANSTFGDVAGLMKEQKLNSVCQSARCPNIGECWGRGTATFMILGDICTRKCSFCAIGSGKPEPPDPDEPYRLVKAAKEMGLHWIVVTSVDRDDLPDAGAGHFAAVINEVRREMPDAGIETLVPDFRRREQIAVDILSESPPNIMNHNIETVPRLYRQIRPGANYEGSLKLLEMFSERGLVTKAGLFVGVGEEMEEVREVLRDMRSSGVKSLTVGQYLQPSKDQMPVTRYVLPDEFQELSDYAYSIGFEHVASGPLVRSSYKAEEAISVYNQNNKPKVK